LGTIESLERKIQSIQDLQSVVKTMKALAAVNIREYEKAVESLVDYNRTIQMGLRMLLRNRPEILMEPQRIAWDRIGAIVIGSDQGMCGSLNEQVVSHAMKTIYEFGLSPGQQKILAVGERVHALFEDRGQPVEAYFFVPGSVEGITPTVQELLITIEQWHTQDGLDRILVFYSEQLSGANYRPETVYLLPLDREWLSRLKQTPSTSRAFPLFTMEWRSLFSALIRHYLFVSLFRSLAESLASENASRLVSMQGAEKNIEELLGELNTQFHQQRQTAITEELLDIVSGFEALEQAEPRSGAHPTEEK
jgi:F-type H+-transporting ATPase subunit gamma